MKFSHTLETTASPQSIWAIWTNVDRWPEWDTELKQAQLSGEFRLGATGQLTPKTGPTSTFVISQLASGEHYTFTTQLPFCKLHVRRWLHNADGKTCFTHEVSFKGLLAPIFGRLLGKQFQSVLPKVMQNIQTLAQQ